PSDELRSRLRQAQDKQIALMKLRMALGDSKWGQQWEEASSEPYKREESPQVPPVKTPIKEEADAEEVENEESTDSKVDVVAKLFGKG
ncbi:hypothetical protein OXX69_011918, partial [Metschnikowia pulcherrima]